MDDELLSLEIGTLRGVRVGPLLHFRGVPYAEAARFGAPKPAAAWTGVRDATQHGPVCPQPASPLAPVMGASREPAQQSEDCLTLSVITPSTRGAKRPVMVWLHGGAYIIGSGSTAWYQADALALEGDVVVVSLNYRIGVLGYLQADGVAPGNLGLSDQLAALHWVRRNIAAFGGDAERVTVFGESAGGHSLLALMSMPETQTLFQRAIVQSAHLGLGLTTRPNAARVARAMLRALNGVAPRHATLAQLLEAQASAVRVHQGPLQANNGPAFGPIAGAGPLATDASLVHSPPRAHPRTALLIGTVRDETQAFVVVHPVLSRLRKLGRLGLRAVNSISARLTHDIFSAPARALADAQAAAGANVYTYRFDWTPRENGFGACHTIELPFVFGQREAWQDSPMLGGTPWDEVDRLGREMRAAWTRFAHTGDPNGPTSTHWPRHQPGAEVGRRFGP